jgi:AcrR family transcriptional regulator
MLIKINPPALRNFPRFEPGIMATSATKDIRSGLRPGSAIRRGPGRLPTGSPKLDRDQIIACGLALSRTVPLQDLSIVRVANALGVTPAMIHYHVEGRDVLTSAIVKRFMRELVDVWPKPTGKWRPDLEAVARTMYRHFLSYPGISAFFVAKNRYEIFTSALEKDDEGALFEYLDLFFGAFRAIGMDADHIAPYAIVFLQFIHSSAHHTASHHWPVENKPLRSHLAKLETKGFDNIGFLRDSYLRVTGDAAFDAGLKLIVDGLEAERRGI